MTARMNMMMPAFVGDLEDGLVKIAIDLFEELEAIAPDIRAYLINPALFDPILVFVPPEVFVPDDEVFEVLSPLCDERLLFGVASFFPDCRYKFISQPFRLSFGGNQPLDIGTDGDTYPADAQCPEQVEDPIHVRNDLGISGTAGGRDRTAVFAVQHLAVYSIRHAVEQRFELGGDAVDIDRRTKDDAIRIQHGVKELGKIVFMDTLAIGIADTTTGAIFDPEAAEIDESRLRTIILRPAEDSLHKFSGPARLAFRTAVNSDDFHYVQLYRKAQ